MSDPHRPNPTAERSDGESLEQLQARVKKTIRHMDASLGEAKRHLANLRKKTAENREEMGRIDAIIRGGDMPRPIEEAIRRQQNAMTVQFHADIERDITQSAPKHHRRRGLRA